MELFCFDPFCMDNISAYLEVGRAGKTVVVGFFLANSVLNLDDNIRFMTENHSRAEPPKVRRITLKNSA